MSAATRVETESEGKLWLKPAADNAFLPCARSFHVFSNLCLLRGLTSIDYVQMLVTSVFAQMMLRPDSISI